MNERDYESTLRRLKADPVAFRSVLMIDCDGVPRRLADVLDPWQREDFAALDPACRRIAGQDVEPERLRFYLERGRGHSKTCDIGVACAYLLFASSRKLSGVACAADRDQAALIKNSLDTLLRLNGWLAESLEVQAWKVINRHTGSTLEILAADVASSYGLLVDFAILDEVTHWPKRGLFDSVFSAIAKRRHGLLLVIANAGFHDHWAWELREVVRQDPAWYFHRLDGPQASWISQTHLEEQQRILLPEQYQRLWLNQWSSNSGASLNPQDIKACTTLTGPQRRRDDRLYVAGLDLGIFRDHSALVVLAADPASGMVQLANVWSWNPADYEDHKVDLLEVSYTVRMAHEHYRLEGVKYDFWQCHYLAEELRSDGVPMSETKLPREDLDLMVRTLLDAFSNRRIALFPQKDLERDLLRVRVKEKPQGGYKLESIRDEAGGHADRAVALSLCLPAALAIATRYTPPIRPEVLVV
jgi:phage terminase large subunit-like protein